MGHPYYVVGSVAICIGWFIAGPFADWSDTWQLVINTATTILTWLMVGVLQHSQNRDTKALHTKIDELIRAVPQADNALRGIEQQIERAVDELEEHESEAR